MVMTLAPLFLLRALVWVGIEGFGRDAEGYQTKVTAKFRLRSLSDVH
jgi:hypothetical protein